LLHSPLACLHLFLRCLNRGKAQWSTRKTTSKGRGLEAM
jgi:hypothetical protein